MISICITVVDEPELTKRCINSVLWHTTGDFEIIVCDNGSRDLEVIKYLGGLAACGAIVLTTNAHNVGCGPAWNQEMRLISKEAEYVVILHNDAEVIEDWVSILQKPMGGSVVFVATERCGDTSENRFISGVIDVNRQLAAGPIYMIKRSALGIVGLLDEQFVPIYFDDADWMMRFRLIGYKLAVTLEGKFPHVEFTTTTKQRNPHEVGEIVARNQARLIRKWQGTFLSHTPGWGAIRKPNDVLTWVHTEGKEFVCINIHTGAQHGGAACVAPYRVPDDVCKDCTNKLCWKKTLDVEELAFVAEHGLPLVMDTPLLREGEGA